MSYTLVVVIKENNLSYDEQDEYGDVLKNLTLFRKGRTPDDLRDAMDFWTSRGFSSHIYRDLEDFYDPQ